MNEPAASRHGVDIVPLMASTWRLFEDLLGPDGLQGGCWCAYFRMTARQFGQSSPKDHKQQARQIVRAGKPFGLIAVVNGAPQGWVAVAPRLDNPRLKQSMVARLGVTDEPTGTWSITCFYTHRAVRRSGLTHVLLAEAVRYADSHGARAVEGYPVDASDHRLSAADLYHGELQTFLDAGFQLVARRGTRRALVRTLL